MEPRQIIGGALILLAVAFTAYLSAVMLRRIGAVVLKDTYVKVFRYELAASAAFVLFALDVRFGIFTLTRVRVLRAAGWALRATVALAVAAVLFMLGKICVGSRINTAAPARYAVVLGLALENGRPTDDLLSRLDVAERYWRENPEATLILTGGNPDRSGRTEAAAMREMLVARGVAEDRLILEDQAKDTRANFRNTAQLIRPDGPVVLISSDYHMDRAVRTARAAGFSEILRLPAPSSRLQFVANAMWEVIAELNELTLKSE